DQPAMVLRLCGHRFRLGFGRRNMCTDLFYLLICASLFFLVSIGFTNTLSDAKAIDRMPALVLPPLPIQGNEHPFEERRRLPVEKVDGSVDAKPFPVLPQLVEPVQRVLKAPKPPSDEERRLPPAQSSRGKTIDGQPYPKLASNGQFVPMRRIVHLDLKGAPYKAEIFPEVFMLLARMGATGVVIEWEDMFPYEGMLKTAVNGNAYTMKQVDDILSSAARHRLSILPLVQTFGHLEWILKLEQFAHLRDDPALPQVICVGKPEAWELIKDMLNQVGRAHAKHGLPFYHIGADEIFNMGTCNETASLISSMAHSKDRVTLWHIGRTAQHVKDTFNTTVLAWHDMFAHAMPADLEKFKLPSLLEPVLWSYAEDLDVYLQPSTWEALRPFPRVWGSSAWKGADGPHRFHSNPLHYIRNHESWVTQFARVWRDFDYVQGLIMSGWSRYDHLAILAETLPIGVPALAMSMETMMEARPMNGRYPATKDVLQCSPTVENGGYVYGCSFPGRKIYELVNEYVAQRKALEKYRTEDFEVNGWLSSHAEKYAVSSAMYINKILPFLEYHSMPMERLYEDLRREMSKMFFDDAVAEFLETYLDDDMEWLRRKTKAGKAILARKAFPRRPYVKPRSARVEGQEVDGVGG
ncbi:hypothetical protein PFISCL1PPCAC_12441, partial [Pristionchus fissidentatus]